MKSLAIICGAIASLIAGYTAPANAALIASFSQDGTGQTVLATDNGTQTTISINSQPTTVTAGAFTGIVDFSFSGSSIDSAQTLGNAVIQHYSGNFCFTSGPGCSGINYLTGVYSDAAFGALGGPGLILNVNNPPDQLTLTSSVVPASQLAPPDTFNLTFANLAPTLAIDGSTIRGFTATYAGNVSSESQAVMEPASILVLGVALVGLGFIRRKGNFAQT